MLIARKEQHADIIFIRPRIRMIPIAGQNVVEVGKPALPGVSIFAPTSLIKRQKTLGVSVFG